MELSRTLQRVLLIFVEAPILRSVFTDLIQIVSYTMIRCTYEMQHSRHVWKVLNPSKAVGDVMKRRLPRHAVLILSPPRAGQLTAVGRRS